MASKDIREDFPLLKETGVAYLDNGATTQKPQEVLDVTEDYYLHANANVHRGIHKLADESTKRYEAARHSIAKFLHCRDDEVIFTSGTTHSMNMAAHIAGQYLQPGDEILVTVDCHHSTLVPFQQLALRKGVKFNVVHLNEEQSITEDMISKAVTPKTKIIAIMQTSNVLGYSLNIEKIRKQKALLVVDAAQALVHAEVKLDNADFIAASGHKAYGPMGIGILAGKKKLLEKAEPLFYGGSMIQEVDEQVSTWAQLPSRHEAGTPNVAGAIGFAAALQYYDKHRKEALKREMELTDKAVAIISKYGTVYGPKKKQAPIVSFNLPKAHPHDVSQILDSFGVAVRAGQHCCEPLHDQLSIQASVRVSIAMYNNEEDLKKLEAGLHQARKVFG